MSLPDKNHPSGFRGKINLRSSKGFNCRDIDFQIVENPWNSRQVYGYLTERKRVVSFSGRKSFYAGRILPCCHYMLLLGHITQIYCCEKLSRLKKC